MALYLYNGNLREGDVLPYNGLSKAQILVILHAAAKEIKAARQLLKRVGRLELCDTELSLREARYLLRNIYRDSVVSFLGAKALFLDLRRADCFDPQRYDEANGGPGTAAAALAAFAAAHEPAPAPVPIVASKSIDLWLGGAWKLVRAPRGRSVQGKGTASVVKITCDAWMAIDGGSEVCIRKIGIGRAAGQVFWFTLANAAYEGEVGRYELEYALTRILATRLVRERLTAYLDHRIQPSMNLHGRYPPPPPLEVIELPAADEVERYVDPDSVPSRWLIDGLLIGQETGARGLIGFGRERSKQVVWMWRDAAGLQNWYTQPIADLNFQTPFFLTERSDDAAYVIVELAKKLLV